MDRCIIYVKKHKDIDKLIDSLKYEFILKRKDDIARFLGIRIVKDDVKETVTLSQQSFMDRI